MNSSCKQESASTKSSSNSAPEETSFGLKLAIVGATVCLLTGGVLFVSANAHVPVSTASQALINQSGSTAVQPNKLNKLNQIDKTVLNLKFGAYATKPATPSVQANSVASHFSSNKSALNKSSFIQSSPNKPSLNKLCNITTQQTKQFKTALRNEHLKIQALQMLRSMPAYKVGSAIKSNAKRVNQLAPAVVNVNAFLLSNRVSNDSQLARLQWQATFAEFSSRLFIDAPVESPAHKQAAIKTVAHSLNGVGFPHIETNDRSDSERYKPYRQLVSFNDEGHSEVVPYIKCMGLSPEAVAARAERYNDKIFFLAVKHNVSSSLVKAVVTKESCFNAKARSHVGAIGLMQLMPETAKWLKVSKPENVDQNLEAGIRYLAQLRKRFGSNELALAAYNAGPGNVERYNGIPPFAETQAYVKDVLHFYRGYVATTRFVNARNDFE